MSLMLNPVQINHIILNIKHLPTHRLVIAMEALEDIVKEHGATQHELRLLAAINQELGERNGRTSIQDRVEATTVQEEQEDLSPEVKERDNT